MAKYKGSGRLTHEEDGEGVSRAVRCHGQRLSCAETGSALFLKSLPAG